MSGSSKKGVGCLTVIGIVLLVLKLVGVQPVAGWSWIWVLCPFWIGLAIELALLGFTMLMMLICVLCRRG